MTFVTVLAGLVGLALGSFGNVMIWRIHERKNVSGRSVCPSCRKPIAWYDLVPVLSYAVLGGRCRRCKKPVSLQYPAVELASMLMFLFALAVTPDPVAGFLTGFPLTFLLLACVYDAKYQQLPDVFTLLIAVGACVLLAVTGGDVVDAGIGALIPAAWFGGQRLLSRGKAVGSGDVLLGGALGLLLGMRGAITMLLLSYMAGAVIVVVLLLLGKLSFRKNTRIAFGPFMGIATVLTLAGAGEAYLSLLQ